MKAPYPIVLLGARIPPASDNVCPVATPIVPATSTGGHF